MNSFERNLCESLTFDKYIFVIAIYLNVLVWEMRNVFRLAPVLGFLIQFWLIIKPCKYADLFICSICSPYHLSQWRFTPIDIAVTKLSRVIYLYGALLCSNDKYIGKQT